MRYLGPLLKSGIQPRCPAVEGANLYYYGHSFTQYPAPYNTLYTGETVARLKELLGFGKAYGRGRSGTPLIDQISLILADKTAPWTGYSGSRQWVPGSKGVILLQHYMNEIGGGQYTAGDATANLFLDHWKNTLRTEIALMSAETVQGVESATRTGTWTKLVTGAEWFWNSECYFGGNLGSRIGWNVTGDECWLLLANSQSGYPTGNVKVSVTSSFVNHSTIVTEGKMPQFTANSLPGTPLRNYSPVAYKITGLNALAGTSGTKSVWVEPLESQNMFASACMTPSANPPQIFYGHEPPRGDVVNSGPTGPALDASRRAIFKAAADSVIAEFPNVRAVDLAPGYDLATMTGSKDINMNFHPGDQGMAHTAARYAEAIIAAFPPGVPVNGVQVN